MDSTKTEHYDVLILGAGVSGLSAAHYFALQQSSSLGNKNFRISLIEAQNRYGGRIQTTDFGTGYVELGASVCHGANQANPVFNLACSYDLIKPIPNADGIATTFLHSSGVALDQTLASQLFQQLQPSVFKSAKLTSTDSRTLEQLIDEKVLQLKSEYPAEVHSLIDSAAFNCKRTCPLFGGDECRLLSGWGFGADVSIQGDVLIKGGYQALLDKMVHECSDKVDIRLNEQVTHIDWSDSVIRVQTDLLHYTCHYLLVTFPLGVLKTCNESLFKPKLPADKVQAIADVGFGRVTKIYLQYDRPFWRPGSLNLKLYPEQKQSLQSKNELINVVYGIEEVPTSSNVLIVWATGEPSARIENYPPAELAEKITDLLKLYTGDLCLPTPSKVITSRWNSNQFVQGFKSYLSTNNKSRDDLATLAKPLTINGRERVFFSGEATHNHYFGTVHGARLSALEAAEKMLRLLTE